MVLPLVSVVTVAYNAISTIEQTILSVINQTYPNIEYIIIDGGSTDGTVDMIKKYSDKIAYWVSEPDSGIYNAMNKGIQVASGDWINFMNAGDTFYSNDTIEKIHFEHINNMAKKIVYGDTIGLKKKSFFYIKSLDLHKISRRIICCHQSVFVSSFDKNAILFDEKYKISSDYNLLYLLFLKYGESSFLYYPYPVSIFESELGVSSTSRLLLYKEQLDIRSFNKNIIWYCDWLRYKIRCMLNRLCFDRL